MYLLAKCLLPMESLFQHETFYSEGIPLLQCSDSDDKQAKVLEKMLNGWKVFFHYKSVGNSKSSDALHKCIRTI